MITLDSSAVFALANEDDPNHARVRRAFHADGGPYLVPAGALSEMTYLLETRLGWKATDTFLQSVESGSLSVECGHEDFARIRHLAKRYRDLPLDSADASVIACAERFGGRVLTLDRRDFDIVSRECKLVLEPS